MINIKCSTCGKFFPFPAVGSNRVNCVCPGCSGLPGGVLHVHPSKFELTGDAGRTVYRFTDSEQVDG